MNIVSDREIYYTATLMLFLCTNDPDYKLASDLILIMDKNSLTSLLSVYGGKTIKIPSRDELSSTMEDAIVYLMRREGYPWIDIKKSLEKPDIPLRVLREKYESIRQNLEKYKIPVLLKDKDGAR